MKIAEIRDTISTLNWLRNDFCEHYQPEEFKLANVPARLLPAIEAVERLVIPPRLQRDLADRDHALLSARKILEKWKALQ